MRDECPDVDLKAEHRVFTDFWKGKSGKDATKADWDATWRNWMRREQKTQRTREGPGRPVNKLRQLAELEAEARAQETTNLRELA